MLIDIELCHVYLNNFAETGCLSEHDHATILRGKRHADAALSRGDRVRFSVMLDDGCHAPKPGETEAIRSQIEAHGIKLDRLICESEMGQFASTLIDSLRPAYHGRLGDSDFLSIATGDRYMWAKDDEPRIRSTRDVFFNRLEGEAGDEQFRYNQYSKFRIPLRGPDATGGTTYSCSLLTAVWYLSRLGVSGFELDPGQPQADGLVNVLAIEYLKNEAMACEIIRLSSTTRIKKCAKKIEYIFI